MKYIKSFTERIQDNRPIGDKIKYVRGISDENKQYALKYLSYHTNAGKGKITGLELPQEFVTKLDTENLPKGFDMGIDKDGFYIHTHRGRSKSFENIMDIPNDSIIFIDSTG